MKDGPVLMTMEANSMSELAAITSFASLAAGFVLSTPELLAQFEKWTELQDEDEHPVDMPFPWDRDALGHLASHLDHLAISTLNMLNR